MIDRSTTPNPLPTNPPMSNPPPPKDVVNAGLALWSVRKGRHWLPVSGRSMHPFLRDGDRVLVQCGKDDLRPGDVLVYQVNGRLVIHRLIEIRETPTARRFITCGDNVRRPDPPVYAPQIVGPVVAMERGPHRQDLTRLHWRLLGRSLAWLQRLFLKLLRRLE